MDAFSQTTPPNPAAAQEATLPPQEPANNQPSPSYDRALDLLAVLIETFPASFRPPNTRGQPPFKIGIREDILARMPEVDPALLHKAIHIYVRRPEYLRSLIAGRPRVDLDGAVTQAVITPREIAAAEQWLAYILERKRARRAVLAAGVASNEGAPADEPANPGSSNDAPPAKRRPILHLPK